MNLIRKRLPVFLGILLVWLFTTGFENMDVEISAGIGSVMEDLTSEDIEEYKTLEEWNGKVLPNVKEYVTVRVEPSAEAEAVGRMFKGDGGEILEELEGWTRVRSGEVEGYVNNDYLFFGLDAYHAAQEEAKLTATAQTAGLRIRSEADLEAKVYKVVEKDAKLQVVEENCTDEWICVQYAEEKTGYVFSEYVTLEYELGEAMTIEEIREKEAEEKREKLKQQREALIANGDEVTLLAALIQAEAGNQPYEGQVAVGAVVMNRVKSPRYPNTIVDVIFAPGQFGPVWNGSLNRYLGGPKASCVQAAQEALGGYTTVGDYTHFKSARSAVSSDHIVIGGHVFY